MALRLLSILHKNFIAPVAAADLAVAAAVAAAVAVAAAAAAAAAGNGNGNEMCLYVTIYTQGEVGLNLSVYWA